MTSFSPGSAPPQNDRLGVIYMLISGLAFSLSTAMMRELATMLPETVVMFWRHIFATLYFLPVILSTRGGLVFTRRPMAHFVRSAFGFLGFFGFVWSVNRLPLADATSLAFTAPLWSMILSAVVMGEPVRPLRWLATAVGFSGVLLIVKPGGALQAPVLVGLASALMGSLAMMMVKRLSATEMPDRIAFYFMFLGIFFAAPMALAHWQWPEPKHYLLFLLLGAFTYVGQFCLTRGYAVGQFTKMAPMDYVRVPYVILLGYLAFGEVPDRWALLGMAIIAAASIYILIGGRRPAPKPN